jgi:hypothetical protein
MKITANWLQITGRSTDGLLRREIEWISIKEDKIEILANGVKRTVRGETYNEDLEKLLITDITNEDLMDLYNQIQKVLFSKIK